MSTTTCIIIMAVCLMLSAYFSATETAFSSANTTRLRTLAEKGSKNAALALKLLEQYDRLLSTILIGNNIVNIATASIGTVLFVKHYMLAKTDGSSDDYPDSHRRQYPYKRDSSFVVN